MWMCSMLPARHWSASHHGEICRRAASQARTWTGDARWNCCSGGGLVSCRPIRGPAFGVVTGHPVLGGWIRAARSRSMTERNRASKGFISRRNDQAMIVTQQHDLITEMFWRVLPAAVEDYRGRTSDTLTSADELTITVVRP